MGWSIGCARRRHFPGTFTDLKSKPQARSQRPALHKELPLKSKIVMPSLVAFCLMAGSTAMAYPAQVVGDLNLRAGPSKEFPVVRVLYSGVTVEVIGCESDYQWCDVEAAGQRGWANARYLEATYENRPVIVAQQGSSLALPIIGFVVGAYWASHYRDRYWYDRWPQWNRWHYRPHPPGWRPLPPPRPPVMAPRPPGGAVPQPLPRPPGATPQRPLPRPPGAAPQRPLPHPPGATPPPRPRPQPPGGLPPAGGPPRR